MQIVPAIVQDNDNEHSMLFIKYYKVYSKSKTFVVLWKFSIFLLPYLTQLLTEKFLIEIMSDCRN